jgi:16S rRNA (adenine1518-N6/adenine1519-N6)-dimethyltransferase
VIAAIGARRADHFLEIGPGPGALTSRLAARAGHVTAVEIDKDLAAGLRSSAPRNVTILDGDILDFDLGPLLSSGPLRVAGNLPYNISSPIVFKLLSASRQSADLLDATVMLQREVAERLTARPGTKDYGVLTIFAALQASVTLLLTLPPGAFRPPPKVHSAVVRLTFKPSVLPAGTEPVFDSMVRTMFMQRRKTLSNALRAFADAQGRDALTALRQAGIDPIRRPETLDQPDLLRLLSAFQEPSP